MKGAPGLGEDEYDAPTRAVPAYKPPMGLEEDEPATAAHAIPDEVLEEAPVEAAPPMEEAVEAPPEDEPAGEECDEATFFIEQGLYDEAREILETVLIAYPEHRRAAELMAQVEAGASGSVTPPPEEAPDVTANGDEGRDAFDLAQELANELGDFGGGEEEGAESSGGDTGGVEVLRAIGAGHGRPFITLPVTPDLFRGPLCNQALRKSLLPSRCRPVDPGTSPG